MTNDDFAKREEQIQYITAFLILKVTPTDDYIYISTI